MKYDLNKPCSQCPFRSDVPQLPLNSAFAARVQEMIEAILAGEISFACHQTNEYNKDREGVDGPKTNFCVGAILMLEKLGKEHPEVKAALERGDFHPGKLDRSVPVFDSLEEMLDAMKQAVYDRTPHE